jgi:hypothetical protein
MVEAQVSFVAVAIRDNKYKAMLLLRAVTLIDDTISKAGHTTSIYWEITDNACRPNVVG